jgi:prepilin-type N-terminal cleavage/methylation domain-containing protein
MGEARRQEGFTLLELLVAVTIMVIVTSQLFMVFSSQKRAFHANQRVLDVQEDARLVLDLIAFDTRQAGFMVPRIAGVSSEDGGNAAADRLCVSDVAYVAEPRIGGPPTVLDSRSDHFNTTGVTSFQDGSHVVVATLDIDGSSAFDGTAPNDFDVTGGVRGVIIANGQSTVCAEIVGVDDVNRTIELDKNYDWTNFQAPLGDPAAARVAPAVIYEVDPNTNTLTRNGMTLATSVEDLQVEYWVDNRTRNGVIDGAPAGDPSTEFPVHDLNGNPGWPIDTSRIRRIRVSVMTRTDMREVNADGTEKLMGTSLRPALANRAASNVPDGFQRRRFVASVLPKNLM